MKITRLIIVSNRLPYTIYGKKGNHGLRTSPGGLATGLSSYLNTAGINDYLWIGWPGIAPEDKAEKAEIEKLFAASNCRPIFLKEKVAEGFYKGFCNETLYPLFHYFSNYVKYDDSTWDDYKEANMTFAKAIVKELQPGDIVWIHDYHLMMLPLMLREIEKDINIGFFLHIPFPHYELFRLLPKKWGKELLEGVLGADFIGFHTAEYTDYFLTSVKEELGYECYLNEVITNEGKLRLVGTLPMGIEFERFNNSYKNKEVKRSIKRLEKKLSDLKKFLSIDRLDYTKGILNRLYSYEKFLEENEKWRNKVVLMLNVTPSRTELKDYQGMKKRIDRLVGSINGRFGNVDWNPILYQYRQIPFSQLSAMYNISDVALITPIRDGMNLIAKEYVSSKKDGGVLILSEMAGAAKELDEAILVNPNDIDELCYSMKKALEMRQKEQRARIRSMQSKLSRYDIIRWGNDFINGMQNSVRKQEIFYSSLIDGRNPFLNDYKKAKKVLILLDYDGTLVPFTNHPSEAIPDRKLLSILSKIAKNRKNDVAIISGRDRKTLQRWLGKININIVSEHGALVKDKGKFSWLVGRRWRKLADLEKGWKRSVKSIMDRYVSSVPGSEIEVKEFSIVWHFRAAEQSVAVSRAKELLEDLKLIAKSKNLSIIEGNKMIEVRNAGIDKGLSATYLVEKEKPDMVIAIGDDKTDEDMFKVLPQAYSIKVGFGQTCAKFRIKSHEGVVSLLEKLSGI